MANEDTIFMPLLMMGVSGLFSLTMALLIDQYMEITELSSSSGHSYDLNSHVKTVRETSFDSNSKVKLSLVNLTKTYSKTGITAVSNVNLHLRTQQITALLGKNGAGKSTLM